MEFQSQHEPSLKPEFWFDWLISGTGDNEFAITAQHSSANNPSEQRQGTLHSFHRTVLDTGC